MNQDTTLLIERIRKDIDSRNGVIRELYNDDKIKSSIYALVLKNGGTPDDAHDILTHAIIAFVQQCYSPVFNLKNQVSTYLYAIARYKWINERKKAVKHNIQELKDSDGGYTHSIESTIIGNERSQKLQFALTRLDDKCREVMLMWASQLKMREIAIRMSYASAEVARKKKHQCLNKLKTLIKDI